MKYIRTVAIFIYIVLVSWPAYGQWQTPNHSVPVGRGVSVMGFGNAAPGAAGLPFVSNGASSDPSFQLLGYAGGGTNANSQPNARNNIFPAPVRTGDVTYWNGTIWTTLAGNNSGSNCFGENASGVAAWVTCTGGGGGTPGGAAGSIQYNNAGSFGGFVASGDLTVNTATGVFTFGTVNANVGTFGSATQCAAVTVNAKGLVTAAAQNLCAPDIANITGFGTGVRAALAINIGSAGAPVLFNGAGGTPSSITLTNGGGLPTTGLTGTLQAAQEPAHTGDVTNSAGSLALVLGNVNGNVGTFGSSTQCSAFTVNAKGLITAASQTACAPPPGGISGQIQYNNAGAFGGFTVSGDGTISGSGVLAVNSVTGVTNGSAAAAGKVGERIDANVLSGSAVTLTNNTPANVLSLPLTAGDWEVSGVTALLAGATTNVTYVFGTVSLTSATLDTTTPGRLSAIVFSSAGAVPPSGVPFTATLPPTQFNVTTPTTVFLTTQSGFTVSTMKAYGNLHAIRMR